MGKRVKNSLLDTGIVYSSCSNKKQKNHRPQSKGIKTLQPGGATKASEKNPSSQVQKKMKRKATVDNARSFGAGGSGSPSKRAKKSLAKTELTKHACSINDANLKLTEAMMTDPLKKKAWMQEEKKMDDGTASARQEQAEALLALQQGGNKDKAYAEAPRQDSQGTGAVLAWKNKNYHKHTALLGMLMRDSGGASSPSLSFLLRESAAATSKDAATVTTTSGKGGNANAPPTKNLKEAKAVTTKNISTIFTSVLKDDSSNQSQKDQLQQKALDKWRVAATSFISGGVANGRLLSPPLTKDSNSFSNNNTSSAADQALLQTPQQPVVNENATRHVKKALQPREAASPVPSLYSSQFGELQQSSGSLVWNQSTQLSANDSQHQNEAKKKGPSSNIGSFPNLVPTTLEHHGNASSGTTSAAMAALLAGMGHQSPIPSSLAGHLRASLEEKEQYGRQPDALQQTAPIHNHGNGQDEDSRTILQRQLANELDKASLSRKVSSLVKGGGSKEESHGVHNIPSFQGMRLSVQHKQTLLPTLNHSNKQGLLNLDQGKQSHENSKQVNGAEDKKQSGVSRPSPMIDPISKLVPTSIDHQGSSATGTTSAAMASLLAGMGHQDPIPSSLAEHLQAAFNEQEPYGRQANVVQQTTPTRNHENGRDEDSRTILQKQLANEINKAVLSQKASSLVNGGSGAGQKIWSGKESQVDTQVPPLQDVVLSAQQKKQMIPALESGDKLGLPDLDQAKRFKNLNQGNGGDSEGSAASSVTPFVADSVILKNREGMVAQQPLQDKRVNAFANNTASTPTAPLQQTNLSSLQVLQALQQGSSMSGEQSPTGGQDEQTLLQYLMLKKQMDDINKRTAEQNVKGTIQGLPSIPQRPPQQPSQCVASSSLPGLSQGQISHMLARQSLLSQGSVGGEARQRLGQQSLEQLNQVPQTAIQTILSGNQGRSTVMNNYNQAQEGANRRQAIESILISEENRLRQLREAFQSSPQQSSPAQLQQLLRLVGEGGFGLGVFDRGSHSQLNSNGHDHHFDNAAKPHHELMLERERATVGMASGEVRRALLMAEINASQAADQKLRKMSMLQASQRTSVLSPEMLLAAARDHGIDLQTLTPGQLAQLMKLTG